MGNRNKIFIIILSQKNRQMDMTKLLLVSIDRSKIGIAFKLAFNLLQNLANPPIYFEQIKKVVDPQKSPTHPTLLTAMFEIGICGFYLERGGVGLLRHLTTGYVAAPFVTFACVVYCFSSWLQLCFPPHSRLKMKR